MGEVLGSYELVELLGRGGMGEVYRAYDAGHRRVVALKVLQAGLSADDGYRARFRREAEVAARLTDPHVVPVHRFGEIDGRLYLDMRLVDGEDLASVLDRTGPMAAERAVAVVEQVASALHAAHSDGLVHRDVKPANVLLARTHPGAPDFCYLADFGIAHDTGASSRGRLTATGQALGTFAYMAPERLSEGPVDHRCDVYALACVLFECLTGRRPFLGQDAVVLVAAHLSQPPPRPSDHRPDLAPFDEVVERGMAKRPGDRYGSAVELAAAARAALTRDGAPRRRPVAVSPGATTRDAGPLPPPPPTWAPSAPPRAHPTAPAGPAEQADGHHSPGTTPRPAPPVAAAAAPATRPPTSVRAAYGLWTAVVVLGLTWAAVSVAALSTRPDTGDVQYDEVGWLVVAEVAVVAAAAFLARRMRSGRNLARVGLTVLALVVVVVALLQVDPATNGSYLRYVGAAAPLLSALSFAQIAVVAGGLVALYAKRAYPWFRARR